MNNIKLAAENNTLKIENMRLQKQVEDLKGYLDCEISRNNWLSNECNRLRTENNKFRESAKLYLNAVYGQQLYYQEDN